MSSAGMVRSCVGRERREPSSCRWFEPNFANSCASARIVMKPPGALVFASAFLIGSALGAAALPRQPVTDWVRDLYAAQASRIARAESLDAADLLALFTPEVAALWQAAHKDRELGALPERELDAFFGWHVPPGTRVSFTAVKKVLGTAEAP